MEVSEKQKLKYCDTFNRFLVSCELLYITLDFLWHMVYNIQLQIYICDVCIVRINCKFVHHAYKHVAKYFPLYNWRSGF